MSIYDKITAELEARKDRSAWDRGVNAYALELAKNARSPVFMMLAPPRFPAHTVMRRNTC
mgnify:CR=1 FL=1|nr:MAG TPA: ubiquitin carboxyl-terminal hydrolase 8 [Caudoviricetes sp.]